MSRRRRSKGQSFYLEDNYTITRTGTELLTPELPYTADVIIRRTETRVVLRAPRRLSRYAWERGSVGLDQPQHLQHNKVSKYLSVAAGAPHTAALRK